MTRYMPDHIKAAFAAAILPMTPQETSFVFGYVNGTLAIAVGGDLDRLDRVRDRIKVEDKLAFAAYAKMMSLVAKREGAFDINEGDREKYHGFGVAIAVWHITDAFESPLIDRHMSMRLKRLARRFAPVSVKLRGDKPVFDFPVIDESLIPTQAA